MKIKIGKDRSVYPFRIKVSNQYENKTNFLEFELDVLSDGNRYLFVEIEGKTVPYPLEEKFVIDSNLSWTSGEHRACVAVSNVEIKDTINKEDTLFISNEFTLIVEGNFINPEDVEGAGLPEPLKIVYDDLMNLKNDLEEKVESGYFNGKDGSDGKDGEKGADGKSAYEIAVDNGFVGTEQEWIESLKYDHSDEFQQIAQQVSLKATEAEKAAKSAEESAQSASNGAESASQSATSAQKAKDSASQSATSALQGATSAKESAQSAKESADSALEGATSAKEAKESAEQAKQYADSIKASSDQIAQNKSDIEELRNNPSVDETVLEKLAIKDTATGNPCVITDSADWKMKDLKVYGESYQDGTPSVENPLPIINKEVNQVKVTGKNLLDVDYLKDPNNWCNERTSYHSLKLELQPNNKYVISVSQNNMYKDYEAEYNGKHALGVATKKNSIPDLFLGNNSTSSVKNELVIMPNENVMYINIYTQEQVLSKERLAIVFDELLPNIQLEISNAKTDYEPYKEQLVTLTPPKPLTKWDRLEKRDGVWNWVYQTEIVTNLFNYLNGLYSERKIISCYLSKTNAERECSNPKSETLVGTGKSPVLITSGEFCITLGNVYINVEGIETDEQARGWLQTNNPTIYTKSKTEELIPLSDEEQQALNELTMYYPNTVVHTGTQTKVTYIADPKLYIDKKLQPLNIVQSKMLEIESKV